MKHLDYDRAFHRTPDYIRSAIELGLLKGERRMKARRRLANALTVAAVFAVLLGMGAYGVNRLTAPRPDNRAIGTPLSAGSRSSGTTLQTGEPGESALLPPPTTASASDATPTPTVYGLPTEDANALAPTPAPTAFNSPTQEPAPTLVAPTPSIDPTYGADTPLVTLTVYVERDADPWFHLSGSCGDRTLPQEMKLADALWNGFLPCPDCLDDYRMLAFKTDGVGKTATRSALWHTSQGNYFHVDSNCSMMAEAEARSIEDVFAGGQRACPICMTGWDFALIREDLSTEFDLAVELSKAQADAATFDGIESTSAPVEHVASEDAPIEALPDVVYYTEDGLYFHIGCECSGMENTIKGSLLSAYRAGKQPCPVCLADWNLVIGVESASEEDAVAEVLAETEVGGMVAITEAEPTPAPIGEAEEFTEREATTVYTAPGDPCFHRQVDTGGDARFHALSVTQALTEDLVACPSCLPENEYPLVAIAERDDGRVGTVTLWYTGGGTYFHSERYCSGMTGAASHSIADAFAAGKRACPVCMEGWTFAIMHVTEGISVTRNGVRMVVSTAPGTNADAIVEIAANAAGGEPYDLSRRFFYTPNGKYYHVESDCSGMTGAKLHSARETAASGKKHCPVCIGNQTELYWLPVPREDGIYDMPRVYNADEDRELAVVWSDAGSVFVPLSSDLDQPRFYHVNPECFGMTGACMTSPEDARDNGYSPCPACLPELNPNGSQAICYISDNDALYHADRSCSGIRNSRSTTQIAAQAEGRLRCPVCANKSASPAWTEVRDELGASIADAYSGWIFERADQFDDRIEWFISDGECAMLAATFYFAEEVGTGSASSDDPVRELVLQHGDAATCFFDRDFIESLPAPLSAIQFPLNSENIFSLKLEYEGGSLSGFTAGEKVDQRTHYTSWIIRGDGSAEITERN